MWSLTHALHKYPEGKMYTGFKFHGDLKKKKASNGDFF